MGPSHRFGPASFTSDLPLPSSVACSKVLLADLGCVRASGDSLRAERCAINSIVKNCAVDPD
jgi:hypothetical protein